MTNMENNNKTFYCDACGYELLPHEDTRNRSLACGPLCSACFGEQQAFLQSVEDAARQEGW